MTTICACSPFQDHTTVDVTDSGQANTTNSINMHQVMTVFDNKDASLKRETIHMVIIVVVLLGTCVMRSLSVKA